MLDTKKLKHQFQTLYSVLQFGINGMGEVLSYDVVYAIRQSIMDIVLELDKELDKLDNNK